MNALFRIGGTIREDSNLGRSFDAASKYAQAIRPPLLD